MKKKPGIFKYVTTAFIFIVAFYFSIRLCEKIYPVVDGKIQIGPIGLVLILALPVACSVFIPKYAPQIFEVLFCKIKSEVQKRKLKKTYDSLSEVEKWKLEQSQKEHDSPSQELKENDDHPLEVDSLTNDAALIVFKYGEASVPILQLRLKIGYLQAARIIENLENAGIVGGFNGTGLREILITKEDYLKRVRIKEVEIQEPQEVQKPQIVIDEDKILREEYQWRQIQSQLSPAEYELQRVDSMEGHVFEHWCAGLLKKNGFSNVKVTPGSNDQGVDVLAEKGGIKYAIQCKCYSSDLGNKPVQEVNTGKTIYRCQIGVVMTNRYFTAGAKQAAEATGVLLWDRDKLMEMLGAERS